jgi:hypothetical protein
MPFRHERKKMRMDPEVAVMGMYFTVCGIVFIACYIVQVVYDRRFSLRAMMIFVAALAVLTALSAYFVRWSKYHPLKRFSGDMRTGVAADITLLALRAPNPF